MQTCARDARYLGLEFMGVRRCSVLFMENFKVENCLHIRMIRKCTFLDEIRRLKWSRFIIQSDEDLSI